MREFTVLVGQIFLIALLQTLLEIFLETEKRPYLMKFINIAGIMAGLYLLLQFVFTYVIGQISSFVTFPVQ